MSEGSKSCWLSATSCTYHSVPYSQKGSLSKRTPTSSQQLECAIFLTARSRPGKTIRELVTWSVFRERQPTYCSTFGERTSSRPRWPELLIPMLILTLTRCNVKVSNLVRKKTFEIENWTWLNFAKINEQTGLAVDEIKCLKVGSDIFDDYRVDDGDVDGVNYSESMMQFWTYSPSTSPSNQYITKVCFNLFDVKKQDFLSGDDLGDIMRCGSWLWSQQLWILCQKLWIWFAGRWDSVPLMRSWKISWKRWRSLIYQLTNCHIDLFVKWPIYQLLNANWPRDQFTKWLFDRLATFQKPS